MDDLFAEGKEGVSLPSRAKIVTAKVVSLDYQTPAFPLFHGN